MSKRLTTLLLTLLIAQLPLSAKIKIACIGDSITYGYAILDQEKESYPAQLQHLLGDNYEVCNFGANEATALSNGDSPYIKKSVYQESLEFMPDIVIIQLGSNDSKELNMKYFEEFEDNYKEIIGSYQSLSSSPRVILVAPIRCYLDSEVSINELRLTKHIIPAIENIAYDMGIEIIDGHSFFDKEFDETLLSDRVHPSAKGATLMAHHLARHLLSDRDPEYSLLDQMVGGEKFNYHGYVGHQYQINGVEIKIVEPKIANRRHSWIQRARFWNHEPQMELRLLELGFHLVYCNMEHQFGSPLAMSNWDALYRMVTKRGLNPKMVVEGYSRGGLFIYNWGAKYPKRISAIYADAPVLDPRSWPMGCGESSGSKSMTEKMLSAYGVSSIEDMMDYRKTPIDNAKRVAKSHIPLLHVIGMADTVVPVPENTAPFAEKIRRNGGSIEIIEKPGVGHHPHSLSAPEPIVQFILRAEGLTDIID